MWFGVLELYSFAHDESESYRLVPTLLVLDLYSFAHDESHTLKLQNAQSVLDLYSFAQNENCDYWNIAVYLDLDIEIIRQWRIK